MIVWIDLENSPHALFFRPIIRELQSRGHEVVLTVRDFAQTLDLASYTGISSTCVGHGQPRSYLGKAYALTVRVVQLIQFIRKRQIDLALSHGSRAQVLAARMLGIPSYACFDYDYSDTGLFHGLCEHVLVPEVAIGNFRVVKRARDGFFVPYPGIKEEVYIGDWPLDAGILSSLGIEGHQIIAVLRPPASTAHYSTRKSDELFDLALARLLQFPNVLLVILPRYGSQAREVASRFSLCDKVMIPEGAVDALSLMAAADLVVSGGGTMVREAAVLGTPAYSVFAGRIGTVDQLLESDGRLIMIREPIDIERIAVRKRTTSAMLPPRKKHLAANIVKRVMELHENEHSPLRLAA